jgi:rubrerythrin
MASSETYDAQQLLSTAIALEEKGKEHYLNTARAVSDERVRSVFERLADQEETHRQYLQRILDSFGKALGWPERVDIPQELLEPAQQSLFPEARDLNPQSYASAAEAIRRGIQMEVDSIALYKSLAALAKDQAARNMFNNLVIWEEDHLFILNYWLGLLNR